MKAYFLNIIFKTVSFFIFSVLFIAPVYAQNAPAQIEKIQKIPSYLNESTEQDFFNQSDLYEEHPLGDKFLSYSVRLPKGWHAATSERPSYQQDEIKKEDLNQPILGTVAKYYGPGRVEDISKFEIESQALDSKVSAKYWFLQKILLRGYTLEGMKVYSDNRVEVLYVVVQGSTAFVVRALAEINGSRMIVMSLYVPDKFWKEERAYQQRIIKSFQFLSPEKSKAETTKSYSFFDLLTFDYPISWHLIPPNLFSIDSVEIKLIQTTDNITLNGEMNINIFSTEFENALADEIGFLKDNLIRRGLEIGELIEVRKDYKYNDHIYYGYVEAYKLIDTENRILEHEYWMAIMKEERYYYIVTMLTPARGSEFYIWARNAESFKTVIESFRP